MRVPKRKSEELRKRPTGPFYITQAGLEKLKVEQAELEAKLPGMIAEVEYTKSHGDFSENAAYQDAKHTLRRTHGRIARLKDRIKTAIIIEQGKQSDTVQLGSKLRVEVNGNKLDLEILGSHESDPAKGIVSLVSPLGKALIDHKVGDTVDLKLEDRVIQYKILNIA